MLAVQVAVALDASVDNPAIQAGADLDRARPVLSCELGLQACQVFILTAHEPALHHGGPPPLGVLPGKTADERSMLHVEFKAVVFDAGLLHVEPRTTTGDAKLQW